MRCRSCSKFYNLGDSSTDMELGLFKKILSEAGSHAKSIILTGIGEALFHRDAEEIFDLLSQYDNFSLEFTTNGKLFDEKWIQKFSRINCHVTFSIDGVDNEVFRLNRPGGDFDHIDWCLRRIKEIEDASPDKHAFPFRRRINYLTMRYNMHQVKDMVYLAKEYNAEMLVFGMLNNWGCPHEFWVEQNPLNYRDELVSIFNEAREIAHKIGLNAVIPHVVPIIHAPAEPQGPPMPPAPPTLLERQIMARERLLSIFKLNEATLSGFPRFENCECSIPYNSMYIRADGKTSLCCASWHKEFGDVRTHSISQIWNNFNYRMRRVAMNAGAHPTFCRTCDLPYGLARGNPRDRL